ncbi:MAG: hypothetical protein M1824_003224 [Vezdaea acicularis]|nr:MAG: hypothetical protein M1824_003224 [Vezdaea acicularis]
MVLQVDRVKGSRDDPCSTKFEETLIIWDFICSSLRPSANSEAVDLGGSLAVASRGLYATGVSTDLNGMISYYPGHRHLVDCANTVTYLKSGGVIGDTIRAVRTVISHGISTKLIHQSRMLRVISVSWQNWMKQTGLTLKPYVALAWRDPKNNVDELSMKANSNS